MRTCRLATLTLFLAAAPLPAAEVSYLRDVKPILAGHCYSCHGAARKKADLRLDAIQLLRKGSRSGPVVVAGKAGESLLIDAVLGKDMQRMPPEKEGAALKPKEIAVLKGWIDQGAKGVDEPIPPDPRNHWAFRPPTRPAVPRVQDSRQVLNPIDAFVADRRDRQRLQPNPPAGKAMLLRRVYLDLIGLPPSRAELHAFLADASAHAYEKVVDRLLADPRYGERWGRHWMDIWRYSDPFGLGEEYRYSQRHIWRWRDWIIESLNSDKGYDRMIQEMLAGDELAPADPDTLRATGYLARNWYKYNRNAWLQDTVEYTAAGFLGLTLRCARCHNHKYDPISQTDYYRFRAFFEPHDIRIDPRPNQPNVLLDGVPRAFDANPTAPTYVLVRGDDRQPDKSRLLTADVPAVLGGKLAVRPVQWTARDLAPALGPVAAAARKQAQADIDAAAAGLKSTRDSLAAARTLLERLKTGKPDASIVKALPPAFLHDTFAAARPDTWKVMGGQWVWQKGRLVQKQSAPFVTLRTVKNHPQDLMGRVRYRTTGGKITSVGIAFDVVGTSAWQAIYTHTQAGSSAVQAFHRIAGQEFYPAQGIVRHPLKLNEEIVLDFAVRGSLLNVWVNGQLKIVYRLPAARHAGAFALWNHEATSEFLEVRLCELPGRVALAQKAGETRPSPLAGPVVVTRADAEAAVRQGQSATVRAEKHLAVTRAGLAAVESRIAAELAQAGGPGPAAAHQQALATAASKAERQVAVLRAEEGVLHALQAAGQAGAAQQLATAKTALLAAQAMAAKPDAVYTPLVRLNPPNSTGRRLALARWLTRRENPLTARVAVNHIWMRHFGKPLVPTVANFGLAGKKPTHPELLDWLAVRFMADGWSTKKLHRLLVTSATYQMDSRATKGNPNLAADADNRFFWRMNSRRMEAEVVRDSLLATAGRLDLTQGGPILDDKLGQTSRRRSVYFRFNTEYKMQFLDQFDVASPSECYQRHESVVPQQALALINSALALNQSRLLAGQLARSLSALRGGLQEPAFITAAFDQVLSRPPSVGERDRCARFLRDQAALLKNPAKLTAFPPAPDAVIAPATDPVQRARENLVLVLFNHNDFVTIR